MSLITDESPRDCSRKHDHGRKRWWLAAAASCSASLVLIVLWLTLVRPSSPPHLSLLAATVRFNNNASSSVIIVVDAAFTARTPNAALYEELRLSASYAGVPLRGSAAVEVEQQAAAEVVIMSASLKSPWMGEEEAAAVALLRTRIDGQLRWKVANLWVSGRHGLAVDCVAAVVPRSVQGSSLQSQCATHVLS